MNILVLRSKTNEECTLKKSILEALHVVYRKLIVATLSKYVEFEYDT